MKNPLDLLLYPESLYKKITGSRRTLYAGIIIVGLFNVSYFVYDNYKSLFVDTGLFETIVNIILAALFAVILGATDVVFFSLPLSDLFRKFRKESPPADQGVMPIKIMKVYILSHFIIVPFSYVLELAFFRHLTAESSPAAIYGAVMLTLAVIVWSAAIIARGINAIYSFQPIYKSLVFPVVLLWSFLLGEVLSYIMNNWMFKLFLRAVQQVV